MGDVRKGLVTFETVKVRFVPAFTIEFKLTLMEVKEVIEQVKRMPEVFKEQVPDDVSIDV